MRFFPSNPLKIQVILFAFTRLIFDTSVRMVYPFLDVISRGMGVSLETLSYALTARHLAGAAGPLLSPIADIKGRKTSIVGGTLIFSFSMGLIHLWPNYTMFFAAGCLSFLGMFLSLPAMMAFLGDRVPYQQRGRYMGLVELGWSLSFILAMPLVGLMIDKWDWQSPFPYLAVLGLLAAFGLFYFLPDDRPVKTPGFLKQFGSIFSSSSARACLLVTGLLLMANEVVNLVFGVWTGQSFGLNIAALGAASMVIGISELGGELLTVGITDRFGKERMIFAGLALNAITALALPWLGVTLPGALCGLFFFYLTFEFTLVSALPLVSEILPNARATMLGANAAAISIGRAVGDILAPQIYKFGFGANALAAVILDGLAILALLQIRITTAENEIATHPGQQAGSPADRK